jgi:hypothetical protein
VPKRCGKACSILVFQHAQDEPRPACRSVSLQQLGQTGCTGRIMGYINQCFYWPCQALGTASQANRE